MLCTSNPASLLADFGAEEYISNTTWTKICDIVPKVYMFWLIFLVFFLDLSLKCNTNDASKR